MNYRNVMHTYINIYYTEQDWMCVCVCINLMETSLERVSVGAITTIHISNHVIYTTTFSFLHYTNK